MYSLTGSEAVFILGDFNAYIGNYGGPRSFNALNERGKELITFMEKMDLTSVNSQSFTRGPIETFYSNGGSTLTTTDHVLTKMDTLASVNDCHVQADHPDNLSFHLPIHCVLN